MIDLPAPYAEAYDLEMYWRPLSTAEQARAANLLGWAAQIINEKAGSEDFDPLIAAQVSMDMVKRAMINGDGVTQSSQAMSDMSATVQFANPMGNLYLMGSELDRLTGRSGGSALSLTLTSNVRVPATWWASQDSSQDDDAD